MSYLYYLYLLRSRLVVVMIWLYEKYDWFLMKSRNCLLFVNTCVHSWFLVGSVLGIFFSFLCCVIWWDPCWSSFQFSVLCYLVGSLLVIFLVFCVVVFGGIRVGHLFSFLCLVFCFLYLRQVSCLSNVVDGSGLFILDCPFGFL